MTETEDDQHIAASEIDLTLLANFTHQVINPLNGVAGTLDNLIDGTIGPDRRDQRINAARAHLENCITLVRNLAYLASGDAAFSYSENRVIVVPQVIIEAAMFYQEEGSRRKITINLVNRWAQNKLPGHPETLKQVIMNILDNCIKYSKFGSEVRIEQWIQKGTDSVIISIRNLPEFALSADDFDGLFVLGVRGSNAKSMVASGTGLGLYISRHLLETKHNGTIDVQNDKEGLMFTIKIPGGWKD